MSSRKGMSQGSSLGSPPGYHLRRSLRLCGKRRALVKSDEISALPEGITHRILNFLSTKDAVRTSVLSKKWLAIWRSYSVHDFDEARYERYEKDACRHLFNNAMAGPLYRLPTHGPPAVEKLRVRSLTETDGVMRAIMHTYIEIGVNRHRLTDVDLTLDSSYLVHYDQLHPPESLYNVPRILFTSAKFLTALTLQACEIVPLIKSASMPSLKRLFLKYSLIGDKTLEVLISASQLLEDLTLEFCFGFEGLKVSSPQLKIFKLSTCVELSEVEMDAPSLAEFHYVGSPFQPSHGNIHNADDCTKLRGFKAKKGSLGFPSLEMVTLSNAKMEFRAAAEMLALFRRLVSLTLLRCSFESIPLSFSPQLESVEINSCDYEGIVMESDSLTSVRILNHAPPAKHIFGQVVPAGKFAHLKNIVIAGYFIFPGNHFDFTSGPSLETMRIESCVDLCSIRIRSINLKKLQIIKCEELQVVWIDTPMLKLLRYFGYVTEFSPPAIISNDTRVELHLLNPKMFEDKAIYENKLACFFKSFDAAKFIQVSSDNALHILTPSLTQFGPEELTIKTTVVDMSYTEYLLVMMNLSLCFKSLELSMFYRRIELKFTDPVLHFEAWRGIKCTKKCLSHIESLKFEYFYGSPGEMEAVFFLLGEATHLRAVEFNFRDYVPKSQAHGIMANLAETCFKNLPHVVHNSYIAGKEF